jgi:hypothetical protein
MHCESTSGRRRALLLPAIVAAALASGSTIASAQATTTSSTTTTTTTTTTTVVNRPADPRVGLGAGWYDAKSAEMNLHLIGHVDKPTGFVNPDKMGDFNFANSDLAFRGSLVFQGGYNGIQVWDISAPDAPKLRTTIVCPGGQGDPSVLGNLLFVSVEEKRGRVDCGATAITDTVSADRFRGVRIFDISDLAHPKQVAAVQTCRGSHTHTLVSDPADRKNVYVYVSGTSSVRPGAELAGCSGASPDSSANTSLFRIDVIKVPLARPQDAKIVAEPRIFSDSAGNIAGLWKGGTHGEGTQTTHVTNQCHDITVYPEIGLAAGACSGNGILLDIRNPAQPKRVAEVLDPNFAYWHSATFSNAGDKVVFTDEWGGGTQPRCQATDKPEWGADALFTLSGHTLTPTGYFKIPAAQTATENCVAHNGSLIPVPGRDIMVQAWYQGGISVFDFTDPAKPVEIAFFDRGPMSDSVLTLGGYWSGYWYNGHVVGSEIGRGLDVFELTPSAWLSQNEINAAKSVHLDQLNVQAQQRIVWPATFSVARAYLDQLERTKGLSDSRVSSIGSALSRAEKLKGTARRTALTKLATQLDGDAKGATDAAKVTALAGAVRKLASAR